MIYRIITQFGWKCKILCGNKKIRPTTVRRNWVQGQALNCKVYVQTCLSGTEFGQQKAMTGNARHGEHQTPPSISYLWAGANKSATINDSGLGAGACPCWRRWRDLNSRYGFAVLPHFECGPFSHLGTSPCVNYTIIQVITKKVKPFVQI